MSLNENNCVYFPILFHFHQPINNLSWVMEEAFQKAYFPLLQTISRYPKLKVHLHYSGSLLLWLQKEKPDYLDEVVELYKKKQVEIIGGGFYEPILSILPEKSKFMQIQLMIDWWKRNYNVEFKGVWLAERVWVPNLPSILKKIGIEFTFVDDLAFKLAGLMEEDIYNFYITEDEGFSIKIFPINKKLRYLIPWKDPEESIEYLKKLSDSEKQRIIFAIADAEKLGLWPAADRTTYDICYKTGYNGKPWLDTFFEFLVNNKRIKTVHITEYIKDHFAKGLIYLPTSSYDKMSVWVLPTPLRKRLEKLRNKAKNNEISYANDILRFAHGSIWQNFFVKYSQSNIMHKRMLYCCHRIEKSEKKFSQISTDQFRIVWDNILAAQCNDAYWHGQFGGIYHLFLRHGIYRHINKAEYLLDTIMDSFGLEIPKCEILDILYDGKHDIILNNEYFSCFFSPAKGGTLFSLNLKKNGYNFVNTLTRRIESYHLNLMFVVNDRFEKWSFQDHFIQKGVSNESLIFDNYDEYGDFANELYDIIQYENDNVILMRKGLIFLKEKKINTTVLKSYQIKMNKLSVKYEVNFSEMIESDLIIFSPELNFSISSFPYKAICNIDDKLIDMGIPQKLEKCSKIELQDIDEKERVSLTINFSEVINCSMIPIITIPKNEQNFRQEYQGTSIFPKINVKGKRLEFSIELLLKTLE